MRRAGSGRLLPLLRARKFDVALATLTVVWLAPMATYRYGIDQAVYHYIGAGWLDGRIPYRDTFDIKPPGIYALYALVIALLGKAESSIRIAEIACIVVTGFLAARAVRPSRPLDGVAGATALLAGAFYSSRFGFWDTAQVELWEGACLVAAYTVLPRGEDRKPWGGSFAAGALASVGVLFKVTAGAPAFALFVFLVLRVARTEETGRVRRAVLAGTVYVAGVVAPLALTAAYFAAHGALAPLVEWVGYAAHYANAPLDPTWVKAIGPETLVAPSGLFYGVFLVLWLLGWSEARRDGDRHAGRVSVETFALLGAAVVSVLVQRRYYSYHAAVFCPFLALAACTGIGRAMATRRALTLACVLTVCAGGFLNSWPWLGLESMSYRTYVFHVLFPRLGGRMSRAETFGAFAGPFGYEYGDHVAIASLIESRKPERGDTLHVRGFDPTVYVLTGLYSPSRFMMEVPIRDDYLASFNPNFRDEHERALSEHPPRFIVTHRNEPEDVARFVAHGYGRVGGRGMLVLLERGLGGETLGGSELRQRLPDHVARGTAAGGAVSFAIQFRGDGTLSATSGGSADEGTYVVNEEGRLCLTFSRYLSGKTSCVELVEHAGRFTAYDTEDRDVAEFELAAE